MITIKSGELRGIVEGLQEISEQRLPIKVAYAFKRVAEKITKEFQTFEQTRMKLIMEHNQKDDKGNAIIKENNFQFSVENRPKFEKEFDDLCGFDIELNPLNVLPVKLSQLGDIQLSLKASVVLDKFIIDDMEPEKKEPEPVKN